MNEATDGQQAAMSEEGQDGDALVIDMSGVDENAGGFTVMPRGTYPCFVDDLTYGNSQSSGNPMWTWVFEVEDGHEFAGRKLFFHTPFVENMLPRVKKVLSRIAPHILQGPFKPKEIADSGVMVGTKANVRVDIRKYEGTDRNNVRDVLPYSGDTDGEFLQSGAGS
jgi:hypothetical protein